MTTVKSKKKNKKMLTALAAVLAVVTLVAGTFAWIQSKDDVLNELSTRQITDSEVVIQEIFTPPDSWDPNMEVVKQVNMVNTGSGNALVRASFEEILGLLKKGGAITSTNTYNDTAVKTDQTDQNDNWIPVEVDISAFSGWTTLTTAQIDVSKLSNNPLTGANITVLMKQNGNSYGYFAYRTVSAGVYQKIDLGKNRVNTVLYTEAEAEASGGTITKDTFKKVELLGISNTDKNIKFCWYEGRTYYYDTWAGTTKYVPTTAPVLSPALTLTLTGTPAVTAKSPVDTTAMAALTPAQSPRIEMNFGVDGANAAVTTTLATAVTNKCWYYNQADGWFYYMGILEPGTATKQLLGSLKLLDSAGIEHSLMDYKLAVVSDAIQNTKAAIGPATTGWTIPNGALLDALHDLCEN